MSTRIDGKALAQTLYKQLSAVIRHETKKGNIPTLGIILVGNDPGSLAYIKQKQKAAEIIGAKTILEHLDPDIDEQVLTKKVHQFNADPHIHGLIVQLPLPSPLNGNKIVSLVDPQKDVDGFLPDSPFIQPVANAVLKILDHVYAHSHTLYTTDGAQAWLASQKICVLGRGKTAGRPIIHALEKKGVLVDVIHSQTKDPKKTIKQSDIVISCVGKPNVISSHDIKKDAIVIGVGLHMEEGKLRGDYIEEDIAIKASYYTPTPGGVGPVNVACLWENVIKAAKVDRI